MCLILLDDESIDNIPEIEHPIAYADFSRRDIRALIFHYLYAAEAFDYQTTLESIVDNFNRGFSLDISHDSEAFMMTQQVLSMRDKLDDEYKPYLANWRFERISVCTKLILRLATWELLHTDVDERIVLNEAVELAKCYAEEDAYRFINGILDSVSKNKTT
jgi:N utilization substance protein B